jgi:hypothetical protein
MNVMQRAHQFARQHREEYPTYKAALSAGLKLAHAEAKAAREEPTPQVEPEAAAKGKILYQAREVPADKAAQILQEGVERYRNERRPFLLRDWKSDDYDGRRDFVRGGWW